MKDIFETTNNTRLLLEEQEMHLKAISSQLPKTRLLLQAMLNDIKKMDLNESKKEIPKPESLKIPRKSISKSKSAGNEGFNSNVNSDSTSNSASDDTNLSNSNNHHPSNEQNGMNSKIEKPLLKGKLVENASPFSSPKITKNKSFNNPIENESSIGSNNSESSFNSAKKNRKSLTARLSVITRNISNFSDKDIRNDSLNALKRQSITSIRNSVKLITQKLMPPTEDHLIPDYIPDLPILKEHHIFSTNIWFKKDSQRLDSKELVDQTAELIHKVKFHSESFGITISVKEPVLALLSQIRIFEGLDPNFLKQLCLETSSSLYLRKDIVVDIDSKMETMYMIKSGEVAIDGKLILTSGMYFGERALLIQGFKAPVTVIARTTCTLITFTRTQLEVVLERNHEVKDELYIIAKRKEQESCYDDNDKFPFDFGVFNNGVLPEVSKPFSEASINLEMYNEITPVIQSEMNDIICDMKVGPRGLHRKSLRRPSRLAEVYNGEPSLNDPYLKPE
ncbi:hypothetical protein HDV02_000334 [Globomyces sp. JEL0801]|nr:hypothetical protein HDV02_000334 [Globomyces sp. JEL0801]